MPFFAVKLAYDSEVTEASIVVHARDLEEALTMAAQDIDWAAANSTGVDGDTYVDAVAQFDTFEAAEKAADGGEALNSEPARLAVPLDWQSAYAKANCAEHLLEALQDVLPYAIAAIGLPRNAWPTDSVILKAERAIAGATDAGIRADMPTVQRRRIQDLEEFLRGASRQFLSIAGEAK